MRIYEFSKEHGLTNKEVLAALKDNGHEVQSHMSVLSDGALQFLDGFFLSAKKQPKVQSKPIKKSTTARSAPKNREKKVIDKKKKPMKQTVNSLEESVQFEAIMQPKIKGLALEPMMLSDVAERADIPANELIMHLLKKGIVCAKNQILTAPIIEGIARDYGIEVVEPEEQEEVMLSVKSSKGAGENRLPVVAIVGHVDHGKTTLLDYIRNTRVAAKEKGGITQHLGAYQAKTPHGNLVFLDTPGHAAFTKMRARGVGVADIAILIIAADDGVMPQTIEAIKHIKAAGIPAVVAMNKSDKASPAQMEAVKNGLSQHDLLPEDWGGQTVCVPISALKGDGIDDLLEMISLQAELLELETDTKAAAKGFVLEAKLERGRGPVATVILHQGVLHKGDFFIAGHSYGRVNSLVDSYGSSLSEVGASTPVQVSGFAKLPEAGDLLEVVSQGVYKKARNAKLPVASSEEARVLTGEDAINVFIKTDNKSSKEAIIGSLAALNKKTEKDINIVHSAVGDVSESDISLAANTGSLIYGFNVRCESNAALLAKKEGVSVTLYQIIYKLLEDLEERATKPKVEEVRTKTGTAEVRKVFDIKGLGVIAGSYVKDGVFSRKGEIVAIRNNQEVGRGMIKSLERDRKVVKEVHKGFECAFIVEGFDGWQEGDIAECYITKTITAS